MNDLRKLGDPVRPSSEAGPGRPDSLMGSAMLTYGSQLSTALLSLGNALIVARALGASGRGAVVFLTAIGPFVAVLATCGVEEANGNIAGAKPHKRRALATNSLLFALILGGLAMGAITGLIALIPAIAGDSSDGLRSLTFAVLPVLVLQILLRFLVEADYAFRITNATLLLPAVANVVVNGAFAALGLITVETALVTWLAGQVVATAILVWYVAARQQGFGRPDLALARASVGFGMKSHWGRVMLVGNYRLDQWILGAVGGSRQLGHYSVAVAWAEALFYLPSAITAVQRPDLVRAARREAARRTAATFRIAVMVTVVFVGVLLIAAPWLCTGVFGAEFEESTDQLRLLAFGAFGIISVKQLGGALTAQGKPTLASIAIGVGFATTVTLDFLLIPSFGGAGAAIASTVAYSAAGLAVAVIFARSLGGKLGELIPRPSEIAPFLASLRSVLGARASRRRPESRRTTEDAARGAEDKRRQDRRPVTRQIAQALALIVRFSGLAVLARLLIVRNRASIIVYHDPEPETVDRHLRSLRKRFDLISLDRLVDSIHARDWSDMKRPLVVTIDDGHRDNARLTEVFERHGVRPTLFICTQIVATNRHFWFKDVGTPQEWKSYANEVRLAGLRETEDHEPTRDHGPDGRQALSREEIRRMRGCVDIGAHTRFHPMLTTCSDEEAAEEIILSRSETAELVGRECRHFAFPNGSYEEREVELVRRAGYSSGRTVDFGWNGLDADPYRLRVASDCDTASVSRLLADISGMGYLSHLVRRRFDGRHRPPGAR